MKRAFLLALALAAMLSFATRASEGFDDLVKLAKSGVSEDVLLAYVDSQPAPYALTVDEILYLNDIGVPGSVVAAAIRRNDPNKVAAAPADSPLIQPQAVPVNQVIQTPQVPAVLPPLSPDYDQAVRDAVAKASGQSVPQGVPAPEPIAAAPVQTVQAQPAQTPPSLPPFGEPTEPVIGRPEPIVASAPQYTTQPVQQAQPIAQPTYQTVGQGDPQPQIVRGDVREVEQQPEYISETTVVAPPPERMNASFFYESLSPYGSWVSVDGDNYWQPSVVTTDPSWRPYWNSGSWVYTDYGWTWSSSYSWGWAPFHYGRWTQHPRHGWIWHPDTVWSPAWVHWRSNDAYAGWAPLPPEASFEVGVGFHFRGKNVGLDFNFGLGERDYAFVPQRNFCDNDFWRHGEYYRRDRPDVVINIYNNTTIVKNYYRYDHDRIINNGPGYDSIRRATNRDIKQVRLTDATYRPGEPIRANGIRNDSLTMYRPALRRETPETPQVAIARRDEEVKRAQAERDRLAAIQRQQRPTTLTTPNSTRESARLQAQFQRDAQAKREAEQRVQQRQDVSNRERVEAATREDERNKKVQTQADAREQQRRVEQAQQDVRKAQRDDASNREKTNAAARDDQRRQEAAVRDQAERAQKEAAQRDQATRRTQDQAAQEQQRRLDQAQRDAAAQQDRAQRDAKKQADAQARDEAARDAQIQKQQRQQTNNDPRRPDPTPTPTRQSTRDADPTPTRSSRSDRDADPTPSRSSKDQARQSARDAARDSAKDKDDNRR